jgi:hypothetical protein
MQLPVEFQDLMITFELLIMNVCFKLGTFDIGLFVQYVNGAVR